MVDLISLQGLIAHQRGRVVRAVPAASCGAPRASPGLATAVFDAHLCVAEYLLYGPIPYDEVIELAEELRRRAEQYGALRGVAFATALIGEAALLMGDLERAERELRRRSTCTTTSTPPPGEAHCLQRLAEVRLAQGDREARRDAAAAGAAAGPVVGDQPAPAAAHLRHDDRRRRGPGRRDGRSSSRREATMGENDRCTFCDVMFDVPAAIACADAGDLDRARTTSTWPRRPPPGGRAAPGRPRSPRRARTWRRRSARRARPREWIERATHAVRGGRSAARRGPVRGVRAGRRPRAPRLRPSRTETAPGGRGILGLHGCGPSRRDGSAVHRRRHRVRVPARRGRSTAAGR